MAEERAQRRLAAILAADVVGYSRLMGQDEEGTLATLKAYRSAIDELILTRTGRVFGGAGDSVIAEFASPVEAVRCATEIQLKIDEKNSELPEKRRMRLRIGVNLGDVIVEGDNLFGDGVNIAARLEDLAEPGGICVSGTVYDLTSAKVDTDFENLGEQLVKNIREPIRVYRVLIETGDKHQSAQPPPLDPAKGSSPAFSIKIDPDGSVDISARRFLGGGPKAARHIGRYGTVARGVVGAGLLMSAVVTGVAFSDAAIGLVAFPGVVMSVLRVRGHSAPPLRLRGWNSHCMNWGVGALTFAAFPIAAMLFYGASTLLAAIRGYAGCEIFAVPNWLRGRDDQISCPVFTPIDAFEARLRR